MELPRLTLFSFNKDSKVTLPVDILTTFYTPFTFKGITIGKQSTVLIDVQGYCPVSTRRPINPIIQQTPSLSVSTLPANVTYRNKRIVTMAADLADLLVDVPVVVVGPESVLVLAAPRLLLPLGQLGAAEAAGGTAFKDVRPNRERIESCDSF